MQLPEALDRYVLQLEADGRSHHTIQQYERHVMLLRHWLESEGLGLGIESIDDQVLARFVTSNAARLRPDGIQKKPTAMNSLRSSLRTFFRFLHDAGQLGTNPARLLRQARCSPPPPRFLPPDIESQLINAIASENGDPLARRDHALVLLLARTGIRISAALGIDVQDVHRETGEITLSTGKGGRPDRIPASDATISVLLNTANGRTTGPLFVGSRGASPEIRLGARQFSRRLKAWATRAGIEQRIHPHLFRHGLAVRLLESTGDLRLVQQALGHKSIASTAHYTSVANSRVRSALLAVERIG